MKWFVNRHKVEIIWYKLTILSYKTGKGKVVLASYFIIHIFLCYFQACSETNFPIFFYRNFMWNPPQAHQQPQPDTSNLTDADE